MSGLRQRNIQKGAQRSRKKSYGGSAGFSVKTPMGLAFSANAKANYALSQLNTEKKSVRIASTALKDSVTLLNPLSQGLDTYHRIGQTVRFVNLSLRFAFANTTAETIWLRYMIVRDSSPQGSAPAITDILHDSTVQSHRNLDYTGRFKIMADKVLTLEHASSSIGYPGSGFNNIFIDLQGMKGSKQQKNKTASESNYGLGNAGTIADIATGAYYLVLVSSATTNEVTFSYESRMRFLDN